MRVVKQVSALLGLKHSHFHSPKMFGYNLERYAKNKNLDFVSYISADIKYVGNINKYRGVHVIRDPRDIIVSAYFSHRYSHPTEYWPELIAFRKLLERLPEGEGLLANMEFTAKLRIDGCDLNNFDSMMHWDYSLPNIIEVRLEDLIANPYRGFVQILDFLGIVEDTSIGTRAILYHCVKDNLRRVLRRNSLLPKTGRIPIWVLLYVVYSNEFSRLTKGRRQGDEDIRSHFRKGVSGDWKNYFTTEHRKFFKEKYNDLLVKLGYEKDDKW